MQYYQTQCVPFSQQKETHMPPVPTGILQKMITKVGLLENMYREKRYRLNVGRHRLRKSSPHQMAKRFRKTTRYTRSRGNSRTIRRKRRYQSKATARMASVQYHTFTLVNQVTLTKDSGKSYSRVAWTSPNTSGVISPLMALNDDPLFKRLLSASDEFKIYSVWGTAFTSAPTGTGI